MQKEYTIALPYHLATFLVKEFFQGKKSPYSVDEKSILGKHIKALLVDRRMFADDAEDHGNIKLVDVSLSNTIAKRAVSQFTLNRIDRYLEEQFKSSLVIWVKAQMQLGSNRYQAVIGFLKFYSLENQALIDRYYQYVKRSSNTPYKILRNEKERETRSDHGGAQQERDTFSRTS